MIIAISGSVGSGKTTVAQAFSDVVRAECIHLTEVARAFILEEKKDLQTFDFDLDALCEHVERNILNSAKTQVVEGHFSHLLSPKYVDCVFVLNRDLKELRLEYEKRGYSKKKIRDNLEVESFNLCFYEALENGFQEGQVFVVENNTCVKDCVDKIVSKLKEVGVQ